MKNKKSNKKNVVNSTIKEVAKFTIGMGVGAVMVVGAAHGWFGQKAQDYTWSKIKTKKQ